MAHRIRLLLGVPSNRVHASSHPGIATQVREIPGQNRKGSQGFNGQSGYPRLRQDISIPFQKPLPHSEQRCWRRKIPRFSDGPKEQEEVLKCTVSKAEFEAACDYDALVKMGANPQITKGVQEILLDECMEDGDEVSFFQSSIPSKY